jgi:hypothetical protein
LSVSDSVAGCIISVPPTVIQLRDPATELDTDNAYYSVGCMG